MEKIQRKPSHKYDLVIIGGGAAGLAAAVSYGQKKQMQGQERNVLILEGLAEPGKKILITGNGKCNLSHAKASGFETTKEFFESLGIAIYTNEVGRAYPKGRQTHTVRDTLVRKAEKLGTEILTGSNVTGIEQNEDGGFLLDAGTVYFADKVIIATGGSAAPRLGSNGDGFRLARKLGHRIKSILPALVPFDYTEDGKNVAGILKGVRALASVELMIDGVSAGSAEGEVQFASDGLSGICIFDLSRFIRDRNDRNTPLAIKIDLAPEMEEKELAEFLSMGGEAGISGLTDIKIAELFGRLLAGENRREGKINDFDPKAAAHLIKNFTLGVSGTKGWPDAQITSGGVLLSEVDPDTFESKIVSGIYFAGEVLDYDGPSGGFNLDWAWVSGIKAGSAAASR